MLSEGIRTAANGPMIDEYADAERIDADAEIATARQHGVRQEYVD